jgi:glycosyltransferase involved in cell wall biosynthesis
MKYSIIIPYRNREEHLSKLIPKLESIFNSEEYEIIVVEQDDNDKFQKNSLYNIAGLKSKGDLLIFHDVDYYPSDVIKSSSYFTTSSTPLYPVGKVIFLDENDKPREFSDIPQGYRNFHVSVGDHSGGVFVLHKNVFHDIKGTNPYYRGWGKEDDDTRERLKILGYTWNRNNDGLFYGLYHEDSKPDDNDKDFIDNHRMLSNIKQNHKYGYNHVKADVEEFEAGKNIRWLKVKNFEYENI